MPLNAAARRCCSTAPSATRLKFFDAATERQRARESHQRVAPQAVRAWTREELYEAWRPSLIRTFSFIGLIRTFLGIGVRSPIPGHSDTHHFNGLDALDPSCYSAVTNMAGEHIGITGYDSFHYVVENQERSRAFYTERFDFKEVARAGNDLVSRSGQQSVVFGAGDVRVCVSTPLHQQSKAARYLKRHPAGVMSLSFRVKNLDETMAFLEKRGGTFLADPLEEKDETGGTYRSVEIATPLGEVAFRFIERNGYKRFAPGFVDVGEGHSSNPTNMYGIRKIDHVTSNGLTMQPIIAWYREVLGMEPFWDISFHTQDVARQRASGSGLRSIVMWEPNSGVKFATNEPLRPHFRDSQIAKFVDDNGGAGVQHIAFAVDNILWSVEELKRRGVEFMETPKAYYLALPERLAALGITNVKEEIAELERLQILVDGAQDKYMLQIFLREAAAMYDEVRAGPFFYEVIQRCGDEGFGYGNFRALFESIERFQKQSAAKRVS